MKLSRRYFLQGSSALALSSLSGIVASGPHIFSSLISTAETGIPKMVVDNFSKKFDPAYLSNGLIGIRPGPNPLVDAMTYVSGYVSAEVPYEVESLSPAPYPFETDLVINEISLLKRPDLLQVK